MNNLWNKFLQSGKVEDYIKYVNNYFTESKQQVKDDATDYQGLNNTGADYRGE